jgi:hypothetical protein
MLRRAMIAAESSGLSRWIVVQVSEVASFLRIVADILIDADATSFRHKSPGWKSQRTFSELLAS